MRRLVMMLGLLGGLVVCSANDLTSPDRIEARRHHLIASAEAAIPPASSVAPRPGLPAALAMGSVRANRYAIPADHPKTPVGRFKLTAYSGPQLGQARPITATGTCARAGRTVAVDPKVIPLGSRIYIEGIGERIAEDVGGGIKGQHIDVYLPSVPQARLFGVRRGTVMVLAPPAKGRRAGSS